MHRIKIFIKLKKNKCEQIIQLVIFQFYYRPTKIMNFEVDQFFDELNYQQSPKYLPHTVVKQKNAKNNLFDIYDHSASQYSSNKKKNNYITGWSEVEPSNPHLNEQKIKIDFPVSHRINKPKQKYSHSKYPQNTILYLKNQLRMLDSPQKTIKAQQSLKKVKHHKKNLTKISQMIRIKENSFHSNNTQKALPIITTFVIPQIVPLRTITQRLNFNSIQGRVMQYAMMQTKNECFKQHRSQQASQLIPFRKKRKSGISTNIRDSFQRGRSKELKATTCQKFKLDQLLNT